MTLNQAERRRRDKRLARKSKRDAEKERTLEDGAGHPNPKEGPELSAGQSFFKENRFRESIAAFEAELADVMSDATEKSRLYANTALCHLKLIEPEDALRAADMDLKYNPESIKAKFQRGRAYLMARRTFEAHQDFAKSGCLEADQYCRVLERLFDRVERRMTRFENVSRKPRTCERFDLQQEDCFDKTGPGCVRGVLPRKDINLDDLLTKKWFERLQVERLQEETRKALAEDLVVLKDVNVRPTTRP